MLLRQHKPFQLLFIGMLCAQKLGIWKILIFFSEIARARSEGMWQLVSKRSLCEPHHIHYSPKYGGKDGIKNTSSCHTIIHPPPPTFLSDFIFKCPLNYNPVTIIIQVCQEFKYSHIYRTYTCFVYTNLAQTGSNLKTVYIMTLNKFMCCLN